MYFVGEEAIADTDITQVSFVYSVADVMQSVDKPSGVSGKILVQLFLEYLLPMLQLKCSGNTPRVTNVDMLPLE